MEGEWTYHDTPVAAQPRVQASPECRPVEEWGLDPQFWAFSKLFAAQVHALRQDPMVPGAYLLKDRVLVRACVQGVIVAVDVRASGSLHNYTIDDGTGLITCSHWWRNAYEGPGAPRAPTENKPYELGNYIRVFGKLTEYREKREVNAQALHMVDDPNAEASWWLEVVDTNLSHYSKPVTVPPGFEEWAKSGAVVQGPAAAQDSLTAESEFRTALLAWLEAQPESGFGFEQLTGVEHLRDLAVKAVAAGRSDGGAGGAILDRDVSRFWSQAVGRLTKEGRIYLQDLERDHYGIIRDTGVMADAIRRIIHSYSTEDDALGVAEALIVDQLRVHPTFSTVPQARVRECLAAMETNSSIYQVTNKRYACM